MTFKELKRILEKEKINKNAYDINEQGATRARDGFGIWKNIKGKYEVYDEERDEQEIIALTGTENEACLEFLKIAAYSWPKLKKYVA